MIRKSLWMTGLLLTFSIIAYVLHQKASQGVQHLFPDKQFHYQAFRTLGHAPYGGALPGEVMSLIPHITDDESWHKEWKTMAEKCVALADNAPDSLSRGKDLLRASNYYRAAEFFLAPSDRDFPVKRELHRKSVKAFQEALFSLGVRHRIYRVPWETGCMLVYYFPGGQGKPVMLIQGGFDSTNEESYFFAGAALIARGYPVILFEGPGQSSMIREFGVRFTPEWHKPVGKVLDYMMSEEPDLAARKKVLVGISLGGLLAGRAAAYENRFDGVVLFGTPYDMEAAALFQMPQAGRWIYRQNMQGLFNTAAHWKAKGDRSLRWGLQNGMWTIGGDDPFIMMKAFGAYTLGNVQDRVRCHVLCLYGERDIYVSDEKQMLLFKNSFNNAASYTLKVFREEDGSAEHCQIGATEHALQEILRWMSQSGLTNRGIENPGLETTGDLAPI